jgi:hypothetical protein
MEFENFEASFKKENRILKIIILIILVLTSISTVSILMQRKYFLYKGAEIFEERPLSEEICRAGFVSLASGNPNSHVVADEIINLVEKEPFDLQVDKILKLYSTKLDTCNIILKSAGNLLAFRIGLLKDSSYPFHYKLIQLDEISAKGAK